MPNPRVIIVTGANRGIGRAICQSLLNKPDITPVHLLAATRKGEDLGLETQQTQNRVFYPRLDIVNHDSIKSFANDVAKEHGYVDVLINNAGVNLDAEYNAENAKKTLDVNYHGTMNMCLSILPHMHQANSQPRIVNLSSVASILKFYSPAIQSQLRSPTLTLSSISDLAAAYLSNLPTSPQPDSSPYGPSGRSYGFSKALVTALTRVLARENPHVLINACCPGWVRTDMGALVGTKSTPPPKTVEEGARIPVRLAVGEIGGVTGEYWANGSVRSKGEGEVQEW